MYLLVTRFVFDFHLRKIYKFFQFNFPIAIDIKGIESGVEDIERKVVIRLKNFEVIAELFPCNFTVSILIVCVPKEEFDIIVADFRTFRKTD